MNLPPLWKIRRELMRAGRKFMQLPAEILRHVYLRRYYDWVLSRQVKRFQGELTFGSETGIYLIFPKNGVLPSHLHALDQMAQASISPVVVSNLPLSTSDLALLKQKAALIIERPNFGYDFGGYRDGVLELANRFSEMTRLWLMNDSAWLVPQQRSWFEDARDLNVDFAAATSNYAMPRVDPADFRDITWTFQVTHRNFHYASYALGIGSAILNNPDFVRYWRKLEIRNDKTKTVRRGEIGLSQWVLRQGYTHRATCEVDLLDRELESLTDKEVDDIARELIIPGDVALDAVKARVLNLDAHSPEGRSDRIALILTTVSRYACAYCLPAYTLSYRGFQFLKKSPLWLSPKGAGLMLVIISRIQGPVGQDIQKEASGIVRQDAEAQA